MRSRLDWLLYELTHWILFWLTHLGWSLRVRGEKNVPPTGPVLILANHQSYLDPTTIAVRISRQVAYLAKKPLFDVPILGPFLRRVHCVPIDQEGLGREGLKNILDRLNEGWPVMVFPEGARSKDGAVHPLAPGVLMIIRRTKAAVLPVGIAGAFEAWPRHAKVPRLAPVLFPAHNRGVAVVYGKPRSAESLAALPRDEALAIIAADIAKLKDEAERIRRR